MDRRSCESGPGGPAALLGAVLPYGVDLVAATTTETRSLMAKTGTKRSPLTRDRIIAAAVAFTDENGIESLSMRKLGHELGVEAMSLYNHVADKDDILSGMVDSLFAEFEMPVGEDWKSAVRVTAFSAKNVIAAHPWAVGLLSARQGMGEGTFQLMDAMMGLLLDAGYDTPTTHHAWHVIASHVMGYAFQEANSPFGDGDDHDHEASVELIRRFGDQFPSLAQVAPHLMECSYDEEFAFGLEIILSGIEARGPS